MSATQVRWLTNHFAQGKISQEEFASLYARIVSAEQQDADTDNKSQRKILRLHPVTRRVLVQIRVFKFVARISTYLLMLAFMSMTYIAFDYYKNNGTLSTFNASAVERYFAQLTQQNLPTDTKEAAEFLASESNWTENHIYQFLEQWKILDDSKKQEFQNQDWFRSFTLALSLQIADQRALIKQGNKKALQRKLLLVKLADSIDNKMAS